MDALRELIDVQGRTLTIHLPDHFQATRVEVIVLDAGSIPAVPLSAGTKARRPSPLLAGTRIVGDIMQPVVDERDWDALK